MDTEVFSSFPFGFKDRIWDLIVSVPDHCLSFYFSQPLSILAYAIEAESMVFYPLVLAK